MPIRSVAESRGVYHPREISLLEDVFAEACTTAGIDRHSPQGQDLAMRVIAAFDGGDTDRDRLRSTLGLRRGAGEPASP